MDSMMLSIQVLLFSLLLGPSTTAELPSEKPVISIDGQTIIADGQVANVATGQLVEIRCHVEGDDVSSVTNVSISCGDHQSETDGTETSLSLKVNKTNNGERCQCRAEDPTGRYDKSTEFTFNVFFGPEAVIFTLHTPVVKLCPSKKESIEIDCDVPIKGTNPKPEILLLSTCGKYRPVNETEVSGNYRLHFSFIPYTGGGGGMCDFACGANNTVIASAKGSGNITSVNVLEAPATPPHLFLAKPRQLPSSKKLTVINGRPANLRCSAPPSIPDFDETLMSCAGHHQYEAKGGELLQQITFNKSNNNDTCTCWAVHPSGCYNLSTTVTLDVQYGSRVTNFTVQTPTQQDNPHQVVVEAGTVVTFVCEGEGNPRPDLQIKISNSTSFIPRQILPSVNYQNVASASKNLTDGDTAFYECVASNGIANATGNAIYVKVLATGSPNNPNNSGGHVGGIVGIVAAAAAAAVVILVIK